MAWSARGKRGVTTPVGINIYWLLKELFETITDSFSLQRAWKRCAHSLRMLGFREQSAMLCRAKAASVQQTAHRQRAALGRCARCSCPSRCRGGQASAQVGGKSKLPLFHPRAGASGAGWLALGFVKIVRLLVTEGARGASDVNVRLLVGRRCSGKPS